LAVRVADALNELHRQSAYTSDDDLVFAHPHTGRPLDRSQVLKRFKRYCKEAGARPQRFHDLRHTFGTQMAVAGVPLRKLQEWMGHADAKTTQMYADYAPARTRRRSSTRLSRRDRGTFHGPSHGPI
jgi:integrase